MERLGSHDQLGIHVAILWAQIREVVLIGNRTPQVVCTDQPELHCHVAEPGTGSALRVENLSHVIGGQLQLFHENCADAPIRPRVLKDSGVFAVLEDSVSARVLMDGGVFPRVLEDGGIFEGTFGNTHPVRS